MPKAKSPSVELAKSVQAFYDYFNRNLIEPSLGELLPNAVITTGRSKKTLGEFSGEIWKIAGSETALASINLNADWLTNGGDTVHDQRDALSTLVHEMVHYYDHLWGRPGKRGYHSNSWITLMKRIGLTPNGPNRFKMSHDIEPDGPFDKAYKAMPKELEFPVETVAQWHRVGPKPKPTLQGKRFKYECPHCGNSCYAKNGTKFLCGIDGVEMHQEGI